MNPHKTKKVDVNSLSPEEQRLFRLYGKLPTRSDHFAKHLKERKYFDSGDYAMSKAGKGDSVDTGAVGSQHPVPENIPHLSSPVNSPSSVGLLHPHQHHHHHHSSMQAGSPVKESSFLHRETSAEEIEAEAEAEDNKTPETAPSEAPTAPASLNKGVQDGIPIRN